MGLSENFIYYCLITQPRSTSLHPAPGTRHPPAARRWGSRQSHLPPPPPPPRGVQRAWRCLVSPHVPAIHPAPWPHSLHHTTPHISLPSPSPCIPLPRRPHTRQAAPQGGCGGAGVRGEVRAGQVAPAGRCAFFICNVIFLFI